MKMPKAILELEMPESCSNCPLEFSGRMEGFCAITEFVTDLYRDKRRPDCPLKASEQIDDDVKQRLAKGAVAFIVACDKTGMFKYATSLAREMFSAEEDACVLCGSYVPEGRMVCSVCEADPFHVLRKEQNYEKG
jgi:hypothetical protein